MTARDLARLSLVVVLLAGTVSAAYGVAETAPTEAVDGAPEAPADADRTEAGRSAPSPRPPPAVGAREATALGAARRAGGGASPTPPLEA